MEFSTILYITLALFAALGFSFWQYLFRKHHTSSRDYIFFSLRAVSIFIVLLLLINPKIVHTEFELIKPNLLVLKDNSQSVLFLEADETSKIVSDNISSSEELNKNFEVKIIPFGNGISGSNSLNFSETQSDLYKALQDSEDIYSDANNAIVLITDGHQNLGRDYKYFKAKQKDKLFPVILGDTTSYKDVQVERVNVNRYAFLNNKFPVEIFINYTGKEATQADLQLKSKGNTILRRSISLSPEERSQIINLELPASSIGIKKYEIEVSSLQNEKNLNNNKSAFAIEVIDERSKVLILSKTLHPDLGALKNSIESNQQRSADIKYLNEDYTIEDYQLIILFQPDRGFDKVFERIKNRGNYLVVTGSQTRWNYLNNLDLGIKKQSSGELQEVFPVRNENFNAFHFEDLSFNKFPPLLDDYGILDIEKGKFDIMLYQEIQGVNSMEPLIAISREQPKMGFILGENIWRWRSKVYQDNSGFEKFDEFFGKLVQNLSAGEKKQRLRVEAENFYYQNQQVLLKAEYFNQNYEIDSGEEILVTVIDSTGNRILSATMVPGNNFYELGLGNLKPGSYEYNVLVKGSQIKSKGNFEVIDYNIEQQHFSSNLGGMTHLANYNSSRVFYPNEFNSLKKQLLENKGFKPVQKSHQKTVPLIDWYYLLFILISTLSAEWFYRKYLGLI
ncbi:VWA domain-containing protein [Christiangramia aquimixticola]|uniref:VWA domain-containing protein n=1 Tax=Christiangramia aquimixticola TaxID=1697558 RepID=UPI003AA7E058